MRVTRPQSMATTLLSPPSSSLKFFVFLLSSDPVSAECTKTLVKHQTTDVFHDRDTSPCFVQCLYMYAVC